MFLCCTSTLPLQLIFLLISPNYALEVCVFCCALDFNVFTIHMAGMLLHTTESAWGTFGTATIEVWIRREDVTAPAFGRVISTATLFLGVLKVHVCVFALILILLSLTVISDSINSSIQLSHWVPSWLQLWVRLHASVTPPLIISMTLAFQCLGTYFAE